MKEKLSGKFASADHAGPKDVADFLGLDDDEDVELIKRDAYEQVQALLNLGYNSRPSRLGFLKFFEFS